MDAIDRLTQLACEFRNQRNWKQFHNPKDMALSMSLEAAEVLELMQWKNGEELRQHLEKKKDLLGEELADVLYWVLVIACDHGIDLQEAFEDKLRKNAEKYPVAKCHSKSSKYTEL